MIKNHRDQKSLIWLMIGLFVLLIVLYRINLNFEQAEKIEITVITKSKYGEKWEAISQGIYAAANEFGVDVKVLAPDSEKDVGAQKILIQTAADNGTDAIIIAPIDYKELNDVMSDTNKQGIPILTMVSVDQRYPEHHYIGLNHYDTGKWLGESAIRQIGVKGVVAIMSLQELTQDGAIIEKGVRDYLGAYTNIHIVDIEENTLGEFSMMMNTLELIKEQKVELFIGVDEVALRGICTAIRDAKIEASVIGIGGSHEMLQYVESGLINELIVPNEFATGYMAIKNMVEFINHKGIETQVYIEPVVVNIDNMYEQKMEKIIFTIE